MSCRSHGAQEFTVVICRHPLQIQRSAKALDIHCIILMPQRTVLDGINQPAIMSASESPKQDATTQPEAPETFLTPKGRGRLSKAPQHFKIPRKTSIHHTNQGRPGQTVPSSPTLPLSRRAARLCGASPPRRPPPDRSAPAAAPAPPPHVKAMRDLRAQNSSSWSSFLSKSWSVRKLTHFSERTLEMNACGLGHILGHPRSHTCGGLEKLKCHTKGLCFWKICTEREGDRAVAK